MSKRNRNSLMCVDPGLGGTGWAHYGRFNLKGVPRKNPWTKLDIRQHLLFGVIRSKGSKSLDWLERSNSIVEQFEEVLYEHNPMFVVLEWPQVWGSSQVSMAATRSGDLLKLAHLCGMLNSASTKMGAELTYLTPGQWKGQLPKDVVERRIRSVLRLKPPNHAADAVGMGLAIQGIL